MKIETTTLESRFVRLEPMAERHREQLRAACDADKTIWADLYPFSWGGEAFDPTWRKLTDDAAASPASAPSTPRTPRRRSAAPITARNCGAARSIRRPSG
jgi:hypothetical protein